MTDPSNPTPRLKASELRLLERLRVLADVDGCVSMTKATLQEETGLAQSTLALAVKALRDAGVLSVEPTVGGRANTYCVQPSDEPSDGPSGPSDSDPPDPPMDPPIRPSGPSDSLPVDVRVGAPTGERAPAHAPAQNPLPTPSRAQTATDDALPPCAPAHEDPPKSEGRESEGPIGGSDPPIPVGRLAVAAAIEAAVAAGRTVDAAQRGRIGNAAQRLATEEDVATIIAGARRLGAGGHADLYTAVRAVKEARPPASAVRTAPDAVRTALDSLEPVLSEIPRIHAALTLLLQTWPRAQIHVPTWEAELGKVREDILLDAVRALAKEGSEWPPHWGMVYRKALEIGQPRVLNERNERNRIADEERIAARLRRERGEA